MPGVEKEPAANGEEKINRGASERRESVRQRGVFREMPHMNGHDEEDRESPQAVDAADRSQI